MILDYDGSPGYIIRMPTEEALHAADVPFEEMEHPRGYAGKFRRKFGIKSIVHGTTTTAPRVVFPDGTMPSEEGWDQMRQWAADVGWDEHIESVGLPVSEAPDPVRDHLDSYYDGVAMVRDRFPTLPRLRYFGGTGNEAVHAATSPSWFAFDDEPEKFPFHDPPDQVTMLASRTLLIDPIADFMKDRESFKKRMRDWRAQLQEALGDDADEHDAMRIMNRKVKRDVEFNVASKLMDDGVNPVESTAVHEMGHFVMYQFPDIGQRWLERIREHFSGDEVWGDPQPGFEEGYPEVDFDKIQFFFEQVSEYAISQSNEAFAETFTMWFYGKKLPFLIEDMMEYALGDHVEKPE